MKSITKVTVVLFLAVSPSVLAPTMAQSTLDIDEQRAATLNKLDSVIPAPGKVREIAKELFSKPLAEQDTEVLQSLAKQSNSYANMVNFIKDEYDDYRRESYRYDFVLKKLSPTLRSYSQVVNEFLGIRNQAYFNLGLKEKEAGNHIQALVWFRDAYRLSVFDCGKDQAPQECMRWKAEREMQKLLGLSSITAYVTWQ